MDKVFEAWWEENVKDQVAYSRSQVREVVKIALEASPPQSEAFELLKEIYNKTECENADTCRYKSTFYMKTYDKLEKMMKQG